MKYPYRRMHRFSPSTHSKCSLAQLWPIVRVHARRACPFSRFFHIAFLTLFSLPLCKMSSCISPLAVLIIRFFYRSSEPGPLSQLEQGYEAEKAKEETATASMNSHLVSCTL